MNWDSFSTLGYLSVICWVAMPALWLIHARMRPRRWWVHLALLCGLLGLGLAKINSATHVNRIQQDPGEQVAELRARQEAKLQVALERRGDEVAEIRFAEDAADDFIDQGGMDEGELRYMERLEEPLVPDWKSAKKNRSTEGGPKEGLEDLIGVEGGKEELDTGVLEETTEAERILMNERDLMMAHRLDGLNMGMGRLMVLLAVLLVVLDYLRRANVYGEAYFPLPLPSAWIDGMTPVPAVVERPQPARRSMPEEIRWMTKRGDCFVYLTDDPSRANGLPASVTPLSKDRGSADVLRVVEHGHELDDDFVFEALWYGRSSFVVESELRVLRMLDRFVELLKKRRETRARTRQTVHIVWDLDRAIPEATRRALVRLAAPAGFSLFINNPARSSP